MLGDRSSREHLEPGVKVENRRQLVHYVSALTAERLTVEDGGLSDAVLVVANGPTLSATGADFVHVQIITHSKPLVKP